MAERSRTRTWMWATICLVVLTVAVIVTTIVVVGARSDGQRQGLSPQVGATSGTTSASGCHAGPEITNATLLASRAGAPLTDEGAAAFAADLFRWLGTSPSPDKADDLAATIDQVLAVDADTELRESFAQAVDLTRRGQVGAEWAVSTVDGRYYIESSTDHETVVSVSATRELADGSPQRGSQTFTLVAGEQGWDLRSMSQARTTDDLQSLGTPYSKGC